jgi:hypothetical protein
MIRIDKDLQIHKLHLSEDIDHTMSDECHVSSDSSFDLSATFK